jgi:hypothetical protein
VERTVSAPEAPTPLLGETATRLVATHSTGATETYSVKLEDELPLCVFADYSERGKAPTLRDVRKQTLRANSRVVFGTYSPVCLNETCDAVPTQQCWVYSQNADTLVVHSRQTYEHKRGTVCTQDCQPVTAGCETEVLKAGTYTIKYGTRTYSLRVPSVVRAPCFNGSEVVPRVRE